MDKIDFTMFKHRDFQNINTAFLMFERANISTIDGARRQLAQYWNDYRLELRRDEKKPIPKEKFWKPGQKPKTTRKKPDTVKQSVIACPECHKGYLQIKKKEEGIYMACPQCYLAKLIFPSGE